MAPRHPQRARHVAPPRRRRHHADVATFVAGQLLDCVAPSNFVLTNPVVQQASIARGGMNLVNGTGRALAGAWRSAAGDADQPGYRPGVEVACTPDQVVLRNRFIELIRHDPATPQVHAAPLLVVPAWIMKHYILDLSPHNSLVRYLVGHGHSVYYIDPDRWQREAPLHEGSWWPACEAWLAQRAGPWDPGARSGSRTGAGAGELCDGTLGHARAGRRNRPDSTRPAPPGRPACGYRSCRRCS
ncbi:hypothetical protein [Massilia yuzhufengensis]|uniref:hypothetical protein n=1 Tax=Massilia yuzhufengensis TaxID=1164594 RepID=UPI001E4034E0|nr:hypothetical protein [Massilia yuzhufengensis]